MYFIKMYSKSKQKVSDANFSEKNKNFRLKIPLGVGKQSEWMEVCWMPESCYKTMC
jgi:hypothetical protein|nr:MAG TPA: hypothetical protein [Caudoviricetes sp.]